jgi:hypothetical protein
MTWPTIFRIRRCERCRELREFLHRTGPGAHKFYENVCEKCQDESKTASDHAMGQIAKAKKHGVIQRPEWCAICYSVPGPLECGRTQIEAHHAYGYERPLEFWWICRDCNQELKGYKYHSGQFSIEQVRVLLGIDVIHQRVGF